MANDFQSPPAGFDRLEVQALPRGTAEALRHRKTGAKVLLLNEEQGETAFSISFATAPSDDSGVAHLLEHLIFRGSEDYPEDQLFTALRSGHLLSHLNAETRASVTSFHFASPVASEALHVQQILLNAVFHPLLRPEAFAHEGLHRSSTGQIAGVIHHEMTAYLARPEAQMEAALGRGLFPTTSEGRCHGGDPAVLAGLTLAELRLFHRRFYQPGNALVILSGGADVAAHLAGLDAAFMRAERGPCQALCESEPALHRPVARRLPGPKGPSARGWRLPEMALEEATLLAALVTEAAGPGLFRHSGLILDAPERYLQILSPRPLAPDLLVRAAELEAAVLARLAAACEIRASDKAADFRLPPGLQPRAALLGNWLRGGALLAPLGLPEAIRRLAITPEALHRRMRSALADLSQSAERIEVSFSGIPLGERPPPQTRTVAPTAVPSSWRLPLPPRARLPQQVPERAEEDRNGIWLLPDPTDPLLRLCLGFATGGLPEALQRALPGLAAGLGRALGGLHAEIALQAGRETMLLISLKLRPEDLISGGRALIGALLRGVEILPEGDWSEPAHLRLDRHLRARFRAEVRGPLPSLGQALFTQNRLTLATNSTSALPLLRDLRDALAAEPAASQTPVLRPPVQHILGLPHAVSLPILGRGLDLGGLSRGLGWLALKAVESGWLWPELRGKGAAYGLRCDLGVDRLATLISAHDPDPLRSLRLIGDSGRWLQGQATTDVLDRARIAALAKILAPAPPDLRLVETVLARAGKPSRPLWSQGDLEAVLGLDLAGLRDLGTVLEAALQGGPAAVMADASRLRELGLEPER